MIFISPFLYEMEGFFNPQISPMKQKGICMKTLSVLVPDLEKFQIKEPVIDHKSQSVQIKFDYKSLNFSSSHSITCYYNAPTTDNPYELSAVILNNKPLSATHLYFLNRYGVFPEK